MSDLDIPRLLRAHQRSRRLRELAATHPDLAADLDQAADDHDYIWKTLKSALGKLQQLETAAGSPGIPTAPENSAKVARLPSVLSQSVGEREVFEAPVFTEIGEDLRKKRIITAVEDILRVEGISEVRLVQPMDTSYSHVKKPG